MDLNLLVVFDAIMRDRSVTRPDNELVSANRDGPCLDAIASYVEGRTTRQKPLINPTLMRLVVLQPVAGAGDFGEFGVLEMRHHAGLLGIGQETLAGRDQQGRGRRCGDHNPILSSSDSDTARAPANRDRTSS